MYMFTSINHELWVQAMRNINASKVDIDTSGTCALSTEIVFKGSRDGNEGTGSILSCFCWWRRVHLYFRNSQAYSLCPFSRVLLILSHP